MSIFRIQKKAVLSSRTKVHSEQSAQIYRFNKSQQKNNSKHLVSNLIKKRFTTVTNDEYSFCPTLNLRKNFETEDLKEYKKNKSSPFKKKIYSIQTEFKKFCKINSKEDQILNNKNKQICTEQLINTIKQGQLRRQYRQKQAKKLRVQQRQKQIKKIRGQQKKYNQKSDKKNQLNNLNKNKSGSSFNSKLSVSKKKVQQQKEIFELAIQLYNSKNVVKALKLFKQLQNIDKTNPKYMYYIGSCLLNQSNHQKSIQYFQLTLNLNPKHDQNIYLFQAINYKMLNQPAQAISILKQGCKIFPQFEEGLFYLAKLELTTKNYLNAQQHFKKCLILNQKNQLAKLFLAEAKKSNKPQQAINIYKQLINCDNQKIQESACVKLAFLLVQREQWNSIQLDQCFKVILNMTSQSCRSYLEMLYLKCFVSYKRCYQSQSFLKLEQIKLSLQKILQSQKNIEKNLKSIKLLLRIKLDEKDLYGAEYTLNRCQRIGIKLDSYETWKFLIQGINDIIKRKLQEGQLKLQNCIQLTGNENHKLFQFKLKNNQKKRKLIKQQLTAQEKSYIYKKACFYYSYILSVNNNFQSASRVYQKIITHSQPHKKQDQQNDSLNQQQIIIYHNKYISEGIIFHENDRFEQAGQCFKKALLTKERAQSIFLWAINQIISIGQQLKLKQNLLFKNSTQNFEQSTSTLNQKKYKFLGVSCALRKAQTMNPNYSLLYFYHTLVSLYLKNYEEALQLIRMATNTIDQPVSEYYFIQGLTYSLMCQILNTKQYKQNALASINKAIQTDSTIPQFFKQRSKHYYFLQKYELALQDIEKVLKMSEDDEQAQLLCMFYCYVNNEYKRSQQLLNKVVLNKTQSTTQNKQKLLQHKYKQFEQALMLRVNKYDQIGYLARLLKNLAFQNQTKLSTQYLEFVQDLIESRNQYSQFTVYFYNILLACYYTYNFQYYKAINHLFGCLQQIQMFIDEKQKRSSEKIIQNGYEVDNQFQIQEKKNQFSYINTDLMLDEVKFNIVLVTLLKATKQQIKKQFNNNNTDQKDIINFINNNEDNQFYNSNKQSSFQQCLSFLNVFKVETYNSKLLEIFNLIQAIIKRQAKYTQNQANQSTFTENQESKTYQLRPFQSQNPLSSNFKQLKLKINGIQIISNMQVLFPQKLRFNIKPEFDQSFLFNFDIGKVQSKFIPPWFKFSKESCQQLFTQQIRNQSVLLSQTQQKQSVCIQPFQNKQKQHFNTKNGQLIDVKSKLLANDWKKIMKLDSKVQKRLNQMMKR